MNTADRIRQYLFGTLIPTPAGSWPGDDADLFEQGLDSLRVMQLLVFIEQQLGVKLPDEEITPERISTVASLTELVDVHRTASA
jgi:acyl carrier protein